MSYCLGVSSVLPSFGSEVRSPGRHFQFLVNFLSRVAKASSVPPPKSRESANEVYEEKRRRRREKGRT